MTDELIDFSPITELSKYLKELTLENRKSISIPTIGQIAISTLSTNNSRLRDIRDKHMLELPMIGDVVFLYQQLASSREWQITGKPRSAARAVEWANEARTYDPKEGLEYIGFEEFQKRRVVDTLSVGRSAFLVQNKGDYLKQGYLQYLDPTYLTVQREDKSKPPTEDERIWRYYQNRATKDELYSNKDVKISQPLSLGLSKYTSSVLLIYSTAVLAYLVEKHDSNELDGRVIREIFLVNSVFKEALKIAVQASAQLHSGLGGGDEGLGVPFIPINNPTGQSVKDQIATINISRLPEDFDRENFDNKYANMLSAAFGIPLRHFWQISGAGSNRAAEIVQEARAQLKGPAAYVRSEQRLFNRAGIFDIFSSNGVAPRFTYIEEVDLATKKANIDVVLKGAMAAEKLAAVFGDAISPEGYMALMQHSGAIPYELDLIRPELANTQSEVVESSDGGIIDPKEDDVLNGDVSETPQKKDIPDYGEITMNLDGLVTEKRVKVFSLIDYFKNNKTEKLDHERQLLTPEEFQEPDLFEIAIQKTNKENQTVVAKYLKNNKDHSPILDNLSPDRLEDFQTLLKTFEKGGKFSEDDQGIIDNVYYILTEITDAATD